ncbi:extracellular solute-binding protein [Clostridium sp. MCC353]|uniref:extracellular solute-binding protein n=1 Tax=Clostridium sp. MCC353 TaxID=2592646 RepID=UPI001C034166|nr:extracellular solute-binding protein [Clostridium sp. MCC353]MBT9777512.1 extracellular solute-binding protein [Clostridium sp. MCC353]
MKKNRIMVWVSVLLSAVLLAGCGSSGKNTGETKNKANEKTESSRQDEMAEVKKPESIRWMVHDGLLEEEGTTQWVEEFEKKTGIEMTLDRVANNEYSQILELAFASNTVPDVFDLSTDKVAVYAKQNAVADITELVEKSDFYDKTDPAIWDSIRLNGRIYGVPAEKPTPSVTYVRKDWLDRLEMEVPDTYEEFVEMLRRFKNEIPECTVPMTGISTELAKFFPEFCQGANPNFVKKDGKWVDGMGEPNMEAALTNLREVYAEGLLDSEVITNTTANCRDQWYVGSVGVFNYQGGRWGQQLEERVKMNVPEAEVIAIPPIEGAEYQYMGMKLYCISSKLSPEEIEAVFNYFIAYMHDGQEGQILFQSGVEGVHWEQDGEYVKPLPNLSNPKEDLKKCWIDPRRPISPLALADKKNPENDMIDSSLKIGDTYCRQNPLYPVSETYTKVSAELTMLKQEIVAKVMLGELTVEEGLQKYKEDSARLNVEKVEEEMNAG